MRDDQSARVALRWWDTLRPAERIVAMSLVAGGVIAIANSTVWAVAVCYMSHQRARVGLAREERLRLSAPESAVSPVQPGGRSDHTQQIQ